MAGAPTCCRSAFDSDDEERVLSINYTSGTTGRPKGVMYTHRGAYLNALGEMFVHGLGRDSVFLWTLPHVPLQRLVLSVGRHRRPAARHVMLRAVDPGARPRV